MEMVCVSITRGTRCWLFGQSQGRAALLPRAGGGCSGLTHHEQVGAEPRGRTAAALRKQSAGFLQGEGSSLSSSPRTSISGLRQHLGETTVPVPGGRTAWEDHTDESRRKSELRPRLCG